MNPQTGRRRKVSRSRSGISIGTIIFWGAIGWFWFGDTISNVLHKTVEVTVNEEKLEVNMDKTVEKVKTVLNDFKEIAEKEIIKKKEKMEKPTNPDEGKVMTAEEDTEDNFSSDDRFGDIENRY